MSTYMHTCVRTHVCTYICTCILTPGCVQICHKMSVCMRGAAISTVVHLHIALPALLLLRRMPHTLQFHWSDISVIAAASMTIIRLHVTRLAKHHNDSTPIPSKKFQLAKLPDGRRLTTVNMSRDSSLLTQKRLGIITTDRAVPLGVVEVDLEEGYHRRLTTCDVTCFPTRFYGTKDPGAIMI